MKLKFYLQHDETGSVFEKEIEIAESPIDNKELQEFVNAMIDGVFKRRHCYKVELL